MSSTRPVLEESIVKQIEDGNVLEDQGDAYGALKLYLSLWDSLPEPKYSFGDGVSAWLIRCIYGVYFDLKKYNEAKYWAVEIFKCEIPLYSTSELINLGGVCLELGENDEAYECFLKAYEKGKHRAFKGYTPKYWEFFKSKHQ
ncbi:hypothetical protein DZK85_004579 [Escherichia coli]|uniref:hypothetical protein n=1 Tax=Escherichia TaxID=561 RepID=UPI000D1215C4|nr:hypothetical protein [Escherichia coli]EED1927356.1 hypothetical protein [Escherichia coli]EEU3015166.1 hypothetical protein [Escherichia coli]EEX5383602.1 hypothetical protein [Escherichia coli]EFK6851960.1 hypothetical protein [Escherichia coli]EFL3918917.1 hypothetical protein [Escherichia coli]